MLKKIINYGLTAGFLSMLIVPSMAGAASNTVVVTQGSLETETNRSIAAGNDSGKWFFYNDENDTIDNSLGSFVSGPATAPLGQGSAQITVSGTQRRNLATYRFSDTPLADVTALGYSTYNASVGNGGSANRSGYLQFNVDFDGSDYWQRRLTFLPADNGTVLQDQWQDWDAINGGNALWRYSGAVWPVTGGAGSTPKTWSQILADYPGVSVRDTDAFMGIRVGEPYANGYTENLDKFVFGVNGNSTVFDFEPTITVADKEACKNGGWQTSNSPVYKNQGECVSSFASNGKSGGNVVARFFRSLF